MDMLSGENVTFVIGVHLGSVALLACLVAVACRLGKFRPSICHALWLIVLIKLMVPPVVAWPWQMTSAVKTWASHEMISDAPFATNTVTTQVPATDVPQAQATATASAPSIGIDHILLALWVAGAAAVGTLQIVRVSRLRRLIRASSPAPEWLQQRANGIAERFGVKPPALKIVPTISSAMAWNPWRPQILISEHLLKTVSSEAWSGILVHELAHFKRRDLWLGWLELLATCVWWWNPILFVVRRRLHMYAEMACDAWVASTLPETRRIYAETLVNVIDLESRQASLMPALGMASGPAVAFEKRLAVIFADAVRCRTPRAFIVAACALAVLVSPGWAQAPSDKAAQGPAAVSEDLEDGAVTITQETGIRFEMYFVREQITGLPEQEPSDIAKDNATDVPYRFRPNGMITETIQVAGVPVRMDGPTLMWGEDKEPNLPGVSIAGFPTFSIVPDEWVTVTETVLWVSQPADDISEPFEFKMDCIYDSGRQGRNLRLLLTPSAATTPDSSLKWTCFYVSLKDTWQALALDVVTPDSKKEVGTLLIYWRAEALPGMLMPRRGEEIADAISLPSYTLRQNVARPEKETPRHEWPYQYYLEMKVLEAPAVEAERFVHQHDQLQATTSPEEIQLFDFGDEEIAQELLQKHDANWELMTAPRVTFRPDEFESEFLFKVVVPHLDEPNGCMNMLDEFSPSLSAFLKDEKATAVIADYASEMFVDPKTKEEHKFTYGFATVLGARGVPDTDSVDVRLLYNCKWLERHPRRLAFWKPERMPDVIETPVTVRYRQQFGQTVAFVTESRNPGKVQLVFVTMTKLPSSEM